MCESDRGRLPAHDLRTAILMPSPSPNEEFSLHPAHVEPRVSVSISTGRRQVWLTLGVVIFFSSIY